MHPPSRGPPRVKGKSLAATTIVNLGPENQLPNIDFTGKQVTILAHPARIGGKVGLVAEELRVDNQTVRIDWRPSQMPTSE